MKVEGIHSSYLYFARKFTAFGMHLEDYAAHSLNFLHVGAPKFWVVIHPSDFWLLEDLVHGLTRSTYSCSQFVRHESVYIPTPVLRAAGVRYTLVEQREGECVVTGRWEVNKGR
ncbi:hypothetical protein BJ508DRAFT_230808, partial [Ascobolus immersus RN42]